jgi:hypothetical protein
MIIQSNGRLRLKIFHKWCEGVLSVPQFLEQITPAPLVVEEAKATTLHLAHANRTVKSMPKLLTTQELSVDVWKFVVSHGKFGWDGMRVAVRYVMGKSALCKSASL